MGTPAIDLARLSEDERAELAELLVEQERRSGQRLFYALHNEYDTVWDGPPILKDGIVSGQTIFARHKYPRHLEFFAAGATHRERCFIAANRVGKTLTAGAYETACHLTGLYPDWWEGRRFRHPISCWAAGKTFNTTRDIVQLALLGQVTFAGTPNRQVDGAGVVPGHLLSSRPNWHKHVSDLVDTIAVRHVSGRWSTLGFKSYDQGRGSFEGTAQHLIWFDEEPPLDVYGEALIRTMTTDGLIMLTFTPLEGMSQVVLSFMPHELRPAV